MWSMRPMGQTKDSLICFVEFPAVGFPWVPTWVYPPGRSQGSIARTKFSSILSGLLFLSQNLAPGLRLLGTPLALRCHAAPCKRVSLTNLLIAQYHFVHADIRERLPWWQWCLAGRTLRLFSDITNPPGASVGGVEWIYRATCSTASCCVLL